MMLLATVPTNITANMNWNRAHALFAAPQGGGAKGGGCSWETWGAVGSGMEPDLGRFYCISAVLKMDICISRVAAIEIMADLWP